VSNGKGRSFAAAAYPDQATAERALETLEQLERDGLVEIADAAIATRTGDGKARIHQRRELSVGSGGVAGGALGALVGLLLGGPIVGAAIGVAGGAGLAAIDTGIENSRLKELGGSLEPGHAALCVLVGAAEWAEVRDRMQPLGGELIAAELTPEAIAALEGS
jgi:uncharacterized membrane protein